MGVVSAVRVVNAVRVLNVAIGGDLASVVIVIVLLKNCLYSTDFTPNNCGDSGVKRSECSAGLLQPAYST